MMPYFFPRSPYCYLSALAHLKQGAEQKWGKGRWMNLVGSPSFWPHLVMEGDPQERKAQAYATRSPFHPRATWDSFSPSLPTPRSLLNLVLCSQTLNVQIFLPLSSIPVKNISPCGAPPPRARRIPALLPATDVSAVCFSSPPCWEQESKDWEGEQLFDYYLVCLYVKFNDPPLPGSPTSKSPLQTDPYTLNMHMHTGDRTHHSLIANI